MVVRVEIERSELDALQRLGLLRFGDRDPGKVANAVARFVATMPAVAAIGDALFPTVQANYGG